MHRGDAIDDFGEVDVGENSQAEAGSPSGAPGQSLVGDLMRERSRRATMNSVLDRLTRTGGKVAVDQRGWSAEIPDQQANTAR